MATNDDGFLIDRQNFERLRRMVRWYEGNAHRQPLRQRRQPVFQPGAAVIPTVYQCIRGERLRYGTAAEKDTVGLTEPICLCIELGKMKADGLRNFTNRQVNTLRDLLDAAAVFDSSG